MHCIVIYSVNKVFVEKKKKKSFAFSQCFISCIVFLTLGIMPIGAENILCIAHILYNFSTPYTFQHCNLIMTIMAYT